MAVQFELYKTPMPKEKKNKVRYHARPISYETVNTKKLVYRIHDRCSLSPSDVTATLEELKYEVAQCLKEGKKGAYRRIGISTSNSFPAKKKYGILKISECIKLN